MSLINDALRKARQAASEHEAERAGSAGGLRPAYPQRGRPAPVGALVALVAIAAAVAGGAGSWWLLGRQERAVVQAGPGAASPTPTPVHARPELQVAAATAAATGGAPAAGVHTIPEATPEAVPAAREDDGEPVPTLPPVEREDILPAASPPGDERVFILDAEVGGRTLSLGFIVARRDNPFAEINGREVSIGSEIEGFTVEAIDADRVVLRDADGLIVLRVP